MTGPRNRENLTISGCPDCPYTPANQESLPVTWRPAFFELERLRHGKLHAEAERDRLRRVEEAASTLLACPACGLYLDPDRNAHAKALVDALAAVPVEEET